MESDSRDLGCLERGNARQRSAARALRQVLPLLETYDPVLVGTVPLDVDVEGSDLDVVCSVASLDPATDRLARFAADGERLFGSLDGFTLWRGAVREEPTAIVRFVVDDWPVELFAQATPSDRQPAFRHMVVEHRLLERFGAPLRDRVRQLKRSGRKTEPAFAEALGLCGDPDDSYGMLLRWSELDDERLAQRLSELDSTLP